MTRPVPATKLDIASLAKGASAGFSVLLVGELLSPFAGQIDGQVGALWLSLVGAAGFVTAGVRVGAALIPWLQGALAAELALLITVPLRVRMGFDASQARGLAVSAGFGLVVGGLAGLLAGRNRARGESATTRARREEEANVGMKRALAPVAPSRARPADRSARPKKRRNPKRR